MSAFADLGPVAKTAHRCPDACSSSFPSGVPLEILSWPRRVRTAVDPCPLLVPRSGLQQPGGEPRLRVARPGLSLLERLRVRQRLDDPERLWHRDPEPCGRLASGGLAAPGA